MKHSLSMAILATILLASILPNNAGALGEETQLPSSSQGELQKDQKEGFLPNGFMQLAWVLQLGQRIWQFTVSIIVIILEAANRVLEAFQKAFGGPSGKMPEDVQDLIP